MEEQWLKYCPYCGTEYETVRSNPHVCPRCKKEYYINPHPCNAVIIENGENEILLVRRKLPPHKGMWDLPGGFINITETAEESVIRELKEELGITIASFSYFSSAHDRYLYKGVNYHSICFFYRARFDTIPRMKASDDISSYRFFRKKDIPYDDIAFTGIKWALKKYTA